MQDWHEYWRKKPNTGDNVFIQVGKTVNGKPISQQQFSAIILDIRDRLELNDADVVLDLCCGNGLISHQIAQYCSQILAVDFSEPLLTIAKQKFQTLNTRYVLADVCKLPDIILQSPITKIYMYEALQHLNLDQTTQLFAQLARLHKPLPKFYLGAVPDFKRIWNFYNTKERREEFETRKKNGTEAIGHWWNREELECLASDHGFDVQFIEQSASEHGSHYRFDMLCVPKNK